MIQKPIDPTYGQLQTNKTLIEKESDFPVQDATTITLNGIYQINATIITAKRFIIPTGGASYFTSALAIWGVVYTGTGAMFSGGDIESHNIDQTWISAPNGALYDIEDVISPWTSTVYLINSAVIDFASLGTLKNIALHSWFFNAWFDIWQGCICDGVDIVSFSQSQSKFWKNESNAVMFTFQGTISTIGMDNMFYLTNANESIFDFKAALNVWSVIVSSSSNDPTSTGKIFAPSSRTQTDVDIIFNGNPNMPESKANIQLTLEENTTATAVGTINTPKIVAGTLTDSA